MAHPCKSEAFTLLELMLVVSVISFLSVLLLPGISSARNRALNTKCIDSQRLIWQAVNRYEMDYNTTLFTIRNDGVTIRNTLVNGSYIDSQNAFQCPLAQIKGYDDILLTYNGIDFQNTYCSTAPTQHLLR